MASDVEEPDYRVLEAEGRFELRQYGGYVVARTELTGDFRQSLNRGFRRLADYIFGNNGEQRSIAMTAPVGHTRTGSGYSVTFAMPSGSTLGNLPAPRDGRVELEQRPARRVAVLRFKGWARESVTGDKTDRLRREMQERGLSAAGPPELAQYDPPWQLPFLRRNEIQIPVEP